MGNVKCFWLEPQGEQWVYLRRYHSPSDAEAKCPLPAGYHDAQVLVERVQVEFEERDFGGRPRRTVKIYKQAEDFAGDPRWPAACGCGFRFLETDPRQVHTDSIYIRRDTGEELSLRRPPVGAMWNASWYEGIPEWCGPDGRSIVVMTPGGEWMIDSRASNCTMPDDKVHKCWVRHGEPPNLHVDKNGPTCAAGAGSIVCGSYHGFLHHGELTCCPD